MLAGCVAFLSAFMKNVGTLGIFMPIAIQTARRGGRPISAYLMPLAFGSLIGGTMSLIGTSPNLLISTIRQQTTGKPFHLFDFLPVGLPLTCLALVFLSFGWRLIPRGRQGQAAAEDRFEIGHSLTELRLGKDSPLIGRTVEDLEAMGDDDLSVTAVIRGGRRSIPSRHWELSEGDILLVQADPLLAKNVADKARLEVVGADTPIAAGSKSDELETGEAVVLPDSPLIGKTAKTMHLRHRFEVNLLSVSRDGQRIGTRLHQHRFRACRGLAVLPRRPSSLAEALTSLHCLPLADRGRVGAGRATASCRSPSWPAPCTTGGARAGPGRDRLPGRRGRGHAAAPCQPEGCL